MPTRADVITRALRRLGVVAKDDAPDADDEALAGEVLDALFVEVQETQAVTWALSAVPDEAFLPLANLLACDVAPDFSVAAPTPRAVALRRLLAVIRPDNRADPRDLDNNGTIDAEETAAGERARFY